MGIEQFVQAIQHPSYVIGAEGQATAVLVDIATWRAVIGYLEDVEDSKVLQAAAKDLAALAQGQRPAGWKSWEEFEAEMAGEWNNPQSAIRNLQSGGWH